MTSMVMATVAQGGKAAMNARFTVEEGDKSFERLEDAENDDQHSGDGDPARPTGGRCPTAGRR